MAVSEKPTLLEATDPKDGFQGLGKKRRKRREKKGVPGVEKVKRNKKKGKKKKKSSGKGSATKKGQESCSDEKDGLTNGLSCDLQLVEGEADDIGRWVGTLTDPIEKYEGLLHRILIHEDHERHVLVGEVHLFSDSETPRYGVILGEI